MAHQNKLHELNNLFWKLNLLSNHDNNEQVHKLLIESGIKEESINVLLNNITEPSFVLVDKEEWIFV